MKPASAAPIISDFIDFVIAILLLKVVWFVVKWLILTWPVVLTCERSFGISPTGKSLTKSNLSLEKLQKLEEFFELAHPTGIPQREHGIIPALSACQEPLDKLLCSNLPRRYGER